MKLLDRYVLRNFLQPYFYCIAGFLSIWLIFDVSDNSATIFDSHIPVRSILQFYLTQLPEVLVILLPVALLLALLFCLGRMSRANEIVSMLTAGVSVPRFLLPLIAMGLLTTAVSFGLNYSLAAHAERARKAFFENITRGGVRDVVLNGQIFRNRTDNRTWFIAHLKLSSNEFTGVHVIQQDAQDNIVTAYIATTATYVPETREWNFNLAKEVHYDATGNITSEHILPVIHIPNWSETPYRLRSANVRAELLSVPELRDYLHFNSDFPHTLLAPYNTHLQYRVALPWTCLVVVFMAAPLGIGFSRRGILSSVATAIVLVFSMNFLTHLFLALGEGDRIVPWIAAWTPNIIFGTIGLYLLRLRATNRETPGFNPAAFWRKLVAR